MSHYLRTLCLVVSAMIGIPRASAYDFKEGGLCYTIVSLSESTVEVSPNDADVYEWVKSSIVIPTTVEHRGTTYTVIGIGNDAFSLKRFDRKKRKAVRQVKFELPPTLQYIDNGAFAYCPLVSITLPRQLSRIGEQAFEGTDVENIVIPDSVQYIGNEAFCGATLRTLVIGASANYVGRGAFCTCPNLLQVVCLPQHCPLGLSIATFSRCHKALEFYVPQDSDYNLGAKQKNIRSWRKVY